MSRKIPVSIALAVTIIAMTLTFAITMIVSMSIFDDTVSSVVRKQAMYDKLSELDIYVRGNYFGEIDETNLGDRLARGYVDGLSDRFSTYYTEKEWTEQQLIDEGKLVGIGLELVRQPDGLYNIARVYPGSPAEKAGLQMYMAISKVDGTDVTTLANVRAVKSLLRGEEGTTVDVECMQGTEPQLFSVQRVAYRAPTVEMQIWGKYAYVRISSFGADTFTDFEYLIQQAEAEEVWGYIFDLRGNPGGNYDSAYSIIDLLCPRGTVARSENKSGVIKLLATSDENFIDKPMVSLVNENTGGAAELFAVSLRDLNAGRLVGMKTTGHGTLQSTPYRLSDGSAVTITTAKLLTGAGETYDGDGLLPDVEVVGNVDETMLLAPQFSKDSKDDQLMRALDTVRTMARDLGVDNGDPMPEATQQENTLPLLPGAGQGNQPEESAAPAAESAASGNSDAASDASADASASASSSSDASGSEEDADSSAPRSSSPASGSSSAPASSSSKAGN